MPPLFTGILPALVTPYDDAGELNVSAGTELIERLIRAGVSGLFVCGSTGEWNTLSLDERKQYAEHAVGVANGRVKVMIHSGAYATRDAVSLAKHAESIGADAISALPPQGSVYSEAEVWAYFQEIAQSVSLPLYLYHLPQTFGAQITMAALLEKLALIPNLAGLKFSSYRIDDMVRLRQEAGDRLNILSGCGEQSLSAAVCGADGFICTWYNLIPALFVKMLQAVKARDLDEAREHYDKAMLVTMAIVPYILGGVKWLLQARGIPCGPPRKPRADIPEDVRERLTKRFTEIGAWDWMV